jgi:hypothetical protein
MKKIARSKLDYVDGRFRLTEYASIPTDNGKTVTKKVSVRYPQIAVFKNRVRVGCTTVSRAAALKLIGFGNNGCLRGYVQAEATE